MDSLITVRNLHKLFRVDQREDSGLWPAIKSLIRRERAEVVAVDGVSFSVTAGEIRALIGPNGAGKSTVMKILSGILHPTSGEVTCLGITPWRDRVKYVRHIGAIFGQKSQLLWDLPPVDTFALNRRIYRIPERRFRENVDYFVETFELATILGTPVRSLSLGERMKCEVTAALLHDPTLVFLDEPTIGLDILAKDALRGMVRKVNTERGVTFMLTTHDLDDVENLCLRATLINRGTVLFDDMLARLRAGRSSDKTVELRFTRVVEDHELSRWSVLENSGGSCTVRVMSDDLPAQVSEMLATLPVQDIEMKNAGIEAVIKEMYLSGQCGGPDDPDGPDDAVVRAGAVALFDRKAR
ncbi:ATP-binding cassette domain-containing protein [Dactylosporangium roseum]|uniref:ATP-binding cassette domain-containing protein n=1 Tax=Dactylosporangium roseum TaxID=47989 RepID=A0ABY5ZBC4_9ACTN|nr:ATP-binding cassette domain-containing protein [Dactylosporangium roseum]UWZ39395.1 ATP-binding cassette domain-containing protein [Dactylosporangium roseum]